LVFNTPAFELYNCKTVNKSKRKSLQMGQAWPQTTNLKQKAFQMLHVWTSWPLLRCIWADIRKD